MKKTKKIYVDHLTGAITLSSMHYTYSELIKHTG